MKERGEKRRKEEKRGEKRRKEEKRGEKRIESDSFLIYIFELERRIERGWKRRIGDMVGGEGDLGERENCERVAERGEGGEEMEDFLKEEEFGWSEREEELERLGLEGRERKVGFGRN